MDKSPRSTLQTRFFARLCLLVLLLLTAALLLSCAAEPEEPPGDVSGETPEPKEDDRSEPEQIDYEALGVNELGQIMVLMYHEIGEPEAEWVRTPDNFRRDLQNLYEAGYRLVSMNDVLEGNIDIPAGTSPVVLTFDDGTPGQFRYLEREGELVIDPDCAVGILEEFYREHPDFGLAATFYIFYVAPPFGQREYVQQKLAYLVERGFEIGNHTYSHPNLRRLTPDEARKEIAMHVQQTKHYLPGYRVRSLALPYGAHPEDLSHILRGAWEGIEYHNEGVLLVGAHPAPSPFSVNFRPEAIPRIRASEMNTEGVGMYEWMERLEQGGNRYVSDGNPHTVVVPERLREQLREEAVAGKTVITY